MAGNAPKTVAWTLVAGLLWTPAVAQTRNPQTSSVPAQAEASTSPHPGGEGGYYVEFRAADIGTYGHSYAVFGRTGGRPSYADLHPMGGYAVMALGHVLPVPANTQWDADVLKLRIAIKFRRNLSAAQYQNLLAAVRRARANRSPYWNAAANNCNHFIAELAQSVGMRVPMQFQVSYAFVESLRDINDSGRASTHERARPTPKRSRAAQSPPS